MAVKRRMIRYNPMEGVELPQYRRKVPPPLADEHLIAFLTAADQHPLAPLWWLYGLLGLRRGEGLGVRWCDLDLTRGTVHIRQQIQHLGSKLERGAPKNTGIRILPLPAPVVERLQIHRQALMELHIRYSATWNEEDLVFVTRDGRPWWPSNLTTEFHLIARGVPLPDTATLHGLRHTISTLLAECDANEAIIAAFLGHQKKTVTLQYTHARIEAMRKSQDAVMLRLFPNGAPRWKEE
jgi:integrase